MEICKNTWHYRLFERWRTLKYRGWVPSKYQDDGITLCCYMKAVFLFAYPRIFFQSKMTFWSCVNILLALIIYFEITNKWFLTLMIIISFLLVVLVVSGLVLLIMASITYFFTESNVSEDIIKPYFRAKKQKICPYIEFKE